MVACVCYHVAFVSPGNLVDFRAQASLATSRKAKKMLGIQKLSRELYDDFLLPVYDGGTYRHKMALKVPSTKQNPRFPISENPSSVKNVGCWRLNIRLCEQIRFCIN